MKLEFKYKNTGELPIYKFIEFNNIVNDDSLDNILKEISALAIFCDVPEDNIYKLTQQEAAKYIAIMHENIEKYNKLSKNNKYSKHPKKLNLNDNAYNIDYNVNKLNMAQYVDFQMIIANAEDHLNNIVDLLSIFIIPKGKKYGEDYNMDAVKDDIQTLQMETALGITFFLRKKLENLILNKLFYTRMMIKMSSWMVKDPETKKEMKAAAKAMKEMEKELKKK